MRELVEAVRSGKVDNVKRLIENDEYMRATSIDNSALITAIVNNHDDIADLLIDSKAYFVTAPNSDFLPKEPPLAGNAFWCDDDFMLETVPNQCITRFNLSSLSPLIAAARYGKKNSVEKLIRNEGNEWVNYEDDDLNTALLVAAYNGHKEIVEILIRENANVHHINRFNCSALFRATYKGHIEIVKLLINTNAQLVEDADEEESAYRPMSRTRRSVLMTAVQRNYEAMVPILLNALTDINHINEELICAAQMGNQSMVKELIKKGGSPNFTNRDGETAIMVAAQGNHHDMVQLLIDEGADANSALIVMARAGQSEGIKTLLAAGADINYTNGYGETPLEAAVKAKHFKTARTILAEGVDINAALIVMAKYGYKDMVQKLINTQEVDHKHINAALIEAAKKGYKSIVQVLINTHQVDEKHVNDAFNEVVKKGDTVIARMLISTEMVDKNQMNAHLISAAERGKEKMASLLVDEGADANGALIEMARKGLTKGVQMLLIVGADIHYVNGNNETAIIAAAREKHLPTVRTLLDEGADVNAALIIGAKSNHDDIVRMLINTQQADKEHINTAFNEAAKRVFKNTMEELLKSEKVAEEQVNIALIEAIKLGSISVVRMLIEQYKADVNYMDTHGNTPLTLTVQRILHPRGFYLNESHYINMMKVLLELGANLDSVKNVLGAELDQNIGRLQESTQKELVALFTNNDKTNTADRTQSPTSNSPKSSHAFFNSTKVDEGVNLLSGKNKNTP